MPAENWIRDAKKKRPDAKMCVRMEKDWRARHFFLYLSLSGQCADQLKYIYIESTSVRSGWERE